MLGVARVLMAAGLILAVTTVAYAAQAAEGMDVAESSNMQIIGHSDLKGVGKGGEGLALKEYPGGRRVLFLAHESAPMCFSVIDVTKPEAPAVIDQVPVEASRDTAQPAD